jgi:hypothetical protein
MAYKSADESERRVYMDWVNTPLLDKCWSTLEYGRMMGDILGWRDDLRREIETDLRKIREGKEFELVMLMEEEAMTKRHEKVDRFRLAWHKKKEHQKYERMKKELSKVTLEELDEDMDTIELLVNKMTICESGGYTGKCNIITMDDVDMVDTAGQSTRDTSIRWTYGQMDTITIATVEDMDEELLIQDNVKMANTDLEGMNMDTLPGVVEMMPEE